MHDVIIIGSGASGIAAALECGEHNIIPLMLDVGYKADKKIEKPCNLYKMKEDKLTTDFLVGDNFEYFAKDKQQLPAKLKSPYFDFVTKKQSFFNIKQTNYNAITSYAKGGLANAWGSGLMRFSKSEFDDLPINLDDLLPYYKKLEKEIGVSGRIDDLVDFFGKSNILQEPIKRSEKVKKIFKKYQKNKRLLNAQAIYLGTPRIGVSNNDYDMREGCKYDNLEFWQPNHNSLYTPTMTLEKLIAQDKVDYQNNIFIDSWKELDDCIEVMGYDTKSKKEVKFKTKKLILAAGPLNTSRIVLKSRNDYTTRLNFLDNPAIQLPIFFPSLIGSKLEIDSFGLTQLNLIYKSHLLNKNIIAALVEITSPLRNEFLDKFPFGIKDNIKFIKYILPCMMAVQVFLPSNKSILAKLSLQKSGDILLEGTDEQIDNSVISEATKVLHKIGLLTHKSFAVKVSHGNGIHYGGTLPMKDNPKSAYETKINGELSQNKNIYIVDGSCLDTIPATNYSLSMMANSMRITKGICESLCEY